MNANIAVCLLEVKTTSTSSRLQNADWPTYSSNSCYKHKVLNLGAKGL